MENSKILALITVLCIVTFSAAANASIYPTPSIRGCTPSFDINITGDLAAYPCSVAGIDIAILNVRCGLSHAALSVSGLEEFEYLQEPQFFAAVPPLQSKSFRLDIEIPCDAQSGLRVIDSVIMSNEKRVEVEFSLNILELSMHEPEFRAEPEPAPEFRQKSGSEQEQELQVPELELVPKVIPAVFDLNQVFMKYSTTA